VINPFSDLGKETQNPFLDTRIRIWIFPKKRTLVALAAVKNAFSDLVEDGLPNWIHKLVSLASDGASVNLGVRSSVIELI